MTEQLQPEGWQMVKFGDIAHHISKRVEPSETQLDIYVGLEHLDPHSLKIKRHGTPRDVDGQKLLVKKGQIIFGKRRAYQRKVAIADWDCICSAHAMVLEANPKNIMPDFLPFFMQSNIFMNRAVAISEGSLSPTIKWKVLAEQEFPVPSFENQNRLLRLLKKIEKLNEDLIILAECSLALLEMIRNDFFRRGNRVRLDDVTTLKGGNAFNPECQGKVSGTLPFIKVGDMNHEENRKYINHADNWLDEVGVASIRPNIFPAGAVVFAKVGAALLLNRRRILVKDTAIDNNMMAAIPSSKVTTDYLYHFMRTIDFNNYVQEGALPSVNQKVIGSIEMTVKSLDEQRNICQPLNQLELIQFELDKKYKSLINLKNAIFDSCR